MPLTDAQSQVLKQIAVNRSPESYVADATVLHRGDDTPRFSEDLDIFHDIEDSVVQSAQIDMETLRQADYEVSWLLQTPTFHRAVAMKGEQRLKIEWAQDSAFRFFPIQEDDRCGYRLHDADAAINKVLALAGRDEIRDFVDTLHLHETYLSLGTMTWAACGKDPGFTPEFLLDQAGRHVAYTQADLDRLHLRQPQDLSTMKGSWFAALAQAKILVAALPPAEIGCLYLGPEAYVVTPDPESVSFQTLIRHQGCIRGAWPTVSPYKRR